MSDSDEAAFASADEGETTAKGTSNTKSEDKDSTASSAAAAATATAATATADPVKKDTGQSKHQKKKGKKGGKKNEAKKSDVAKSEPAKSQTDDDIKPKQAKEKTVEPSKTKDIQETTDNTASAEMKNDSKDGSETKGSDSKDEKTIPIKSETPKTEADKPDPKPKDDNISSTPDKPAPPPKVESPDTQMIPRGSGEGEVTADTVTTEPQQKEQSSGWGWGSWGSSILTAASSSVSTFTSQVGEGFSTIVDSVESSLGAPPPEEIARLEAEKEEEELEKKKEKKEEKSDRGGEGKTADSDEGEGRPEEKSSDGAEGGGGGWFSSLGVSSITSRIQNTGKSLVSGSLDAVEALATGGIDVLENIGKKTINVLSDHDPGFKRTRNVLFESGDKKQNLSVLLREAKEQAEQDAALREEQEEARKHNYGAVFDDFQGLAHLEALEILSNQSEKKVQALLSSLPQETISQLKPQLLVIKELFELDDSDYEDRKEHDFVKLITDLLSELHLGTTPDKLNKVQEKNRKWIIDFYAEPAEGEEKKTEEPKEIFHAAISALAELTAKSVEQFHKAGELILLQKDSDTSFEKRSKSLSCLTQVLCTEVSILSTKFTQCLHKAGEDMEDSSVITPFITNVYLEASNSSTYIQDGFQLLLPVLQQAAIQNSPLLQT